MNLLRSALLSVTLFLAPCAMAEDSSVVVTPVTSKPGMVDAIKAFVGNRKDNVVNGLDAVAGYTSTPVLKRLAAFECLKGGRFESSIDTVGRLFVSALIVAGIHQLYKLYNASQEDANDDIIFEEEYDEDNN